MEADTKVVIHSMDRRISGKVKCQLLLAQMPIIIGTNIMAWPIHTHKNMFVRCVMTYGADKVGPHSSIRILDIIFSWENLVVYITAIFTQF